jgi:hypothetical protein
MNSLKPILVCALGAAAALPATAAAGRYPITTAQIAAAVSTTGVYVLPAQVVLPVTIVASVSNPQLKVKSIGPGNDDRTLARLECANPEQCLPFIVTLRTASGAASPSSSVNAPPAAAATKPSAPVVRAGAPATLLLEGLHVHISLAAICLESGAVGQTIRAASSDRKQVYTVRVVREGVLEGHL